MEFCNTAKRSDELSDTTQSFIGSGSMSLLESQRLRGCMQFADGRLFGSIGQLCLRAVSNHGFSGLGPKLRPECTKALFCFKNFLSENKPRRIMVASSKTWYIFTDACYEPTSSDWPCGIGGLIYLSMILLGGLLNSSLWDLAPITLNVWEAILKRPSCSRRSYWR